MTLSKVCKTLKAAERYQDKLDAQYDFVRLIQSPRFTEAGNYIWEVRYRADRQTLAQIKE